MKAVGGHSDDQLRCPQRPSCSRAAGYWMRRARQISGLTQTELARRLGVPIWKLSRLERGLDPMPAQLIGKITPMLSPPVRADVLH